VNQENIYNKEETLIWKLSERDVMIGETGNMDPKSELGVKKALHPPETLHFCGSQGISTPRFKTCENAYFQTFSGQI